jgi:hypothetical protein
MAWLAAWLEDVHPIFCHAEHAPMVVVAAVIRPIFLAERSCATDAGPALLCRLMCAFQNRQPELMFPQMANWYVQLKATFCLDPVSQFV